MISTHRITMGGLFLKSATLTKEGFAKHELMWPYGLKNRPTPLVLLRYFFMYQNLISPLEQYGSHLKHAVWMFQPLPLFTAQGYRKTAHFWTDSILPVWQGRKCSAVFMWVQTPFSDSAFRVCLDVQMIGCIVEGKIKYILQYFTLYL